MDFIRNSTVKIRKPHRCFACGRDFPVGTKMNCNVNADGGRIYSMYACETCEILMNEYSNYFDDACGIFYEDCVGDYLFYDDETGVKKTPEELLDDLKKGNPI